MACTDTNAMANAAVRIFLIVLDFVKIYIFINVKLVNKILMK